MAKPLYALVDCNNFFVSCERVFRPDLWNKPVAVLSNNDGCLVARSNEVKALGIPMGVPEFKVRDQLKMHDVTLFSGNFQLYGDFSQRVVRLLQQACPNIEVYSVDESFLEISSLPIANYEQWARELRECIWRQIGIPVSIGVAPTKTLAKAAAEFAKKHEETGGAHAVLSDDARVALLRWLPVGDVWGVGWRTAPKLRQIGISTAFDLTQASDGWVQQKLSIRGLKTVKELRGEACYALESTEEPQKSIARTRSFGHNIRSYHLLEAAIATFAAQAAAKLRQQGEITRRVFVFLRSSRKEEGWMGVSATIPLMQPTADTGAIIQAALQGLQQIYDPELAYKKGGVVLFDLVPATATQLTLMGQSAARLDKTEELMAAVDQINQRYGTRALRHASEHPGERGWHGKHQSRSPAYTTSWIDLPKVK